MSDEASANGGQADQQEQVQQEQQHDWEKDYKEAQAWGTRLVQEKAELETEAQIARGLRSEDPAERKKALEAVGLTLEDDDANEGQVYDQTDPRILAELAELKQWKESTTSKSESEQNYTAYRQMTDPELTAMKVPAELHDVISEAALNLPAVQTPQGPRPDLQGAYQQWMKHVQLAAGIPEMQEHFAGLPAVQTAVKKAWQKTKPTSAVTSPAGREGELAPDPLDGESRRQRILDRYEANRQ